MAHPTRFLIFQVLNGRPEELIICRCHASMLAIERLPAKMKCAQIEDGEFRLTWAKQIELDLQSDF